MRRGKGAGAAIWAAFIDGVFENVGCAERESGGFDELDSTFAVVKAKNRWASSSGQGQLQDVSGGLDVVASVTLQRPRKD